MKLPIPWPGKHRPQKGRLGLSVDPDGLGVAHLARNGRLEHCRYYSAEGDINKQLSALVDSLQLKDIPCSVVLHPAYYQLLLAEAPTVAVDEMSRALRWKIKDLLDYPLEQAAVEHFPLPDDAYRGRQSMLYAAALRKTDLHNLVDPIEAAGLAVDCVEITELAMHNLVARLPTEPGGVALVQLYEGGGFINLVEEGAVYLSRRLDVGLEQFDPVADNSRFFDALFLEIQRSLDFYESQLGKGIITQLWYAPGLPATHDIGAFLSEQLGLNVSALDLSPLHLAEVVDEELDEQMSVCAPALGAALGPRAGEQTTAGEGAVRAAS